MQVCLRQLRTFGNNCLPRACVAVASMVVVLIGACQEQPEVEAIQLLNELGESDAVSLVARRDGWVGRLPDYHGSELSESVFTPVRERDVGAVDGGHFWVGGICWMGEGIRYVTERLEFSERFISLVATRELGNWKCHMFDPSSVIRLEKCICEGVSCPAKAGSERHICVAYGRVAKLTPDLIAK